MNTSGRGRPDAALAARAAERAEALATLFRRIDATRMAGLPLRHGGLQVAAIGFEPQDDGAAGVLLTPWFMNLLWFPLAPVAVLGVGCSGRRRIGAQAFDFIGAHEAPFGAFEACSLFSPMFEFADQAAAVATARAVLAALRPSRPSAPGAPPLQAARRGFLFGRGAAQ